MNYYNDTDKYLQLDALKRIWIDRALLAELAPHEAYKAVSRGCGHASELKRRTSTGLPCGHCLQHNISALIAWCERLRVVAASYFNPQHSWVRSPTDADIMRCLSSTITTPPIYTTHSTLQARFEKIFTPPPCLCAAAL